jgi:hypothetical protein
MKFELDQAIALLERTPSVLKSLMSGLSEDWTHQNEGPGTWSPFDVLGHLVHGERTDWIPRVFIIMNDSDNKTFTPFDRYAQFEESRGKTLDDLLTEFGTLRKQNIEQLRGFGLLDSDFKRKGIHPELGEVTLAQVIATWVTHDLGHLAQISRVMAKQYKNEVGPWTAYISILSK